MKIISLLPCLIFNNNAVPPKKCSHCALHEFLYKSVRELVYICCASPPPVARESSLAAIGARTTFQPSCSHYLTIGDKSCLPHDFVEVSSALVRVVSTFFSSIMQIVCFKIACLRAAIRMNQKKKINLQRSTTCWQGHPSRDKRERERESFFGVETYLWFKIQFETRIKLNRK